MRKINFSLGLLLPLFLLIFNSCNYEEDDILQPYTKGAVFPTVSNIGSSFYDIFELPTSVVNFTLDVDSKVAKSITIQKTYKGETVDHATIETFPADISISAAEAVNGFTGVTLDSLEVGDVIRYEFVVNNRDGLSARSNVLLNAPVACGSDFSGEYATVVSGTSTDTDPKTNKSPKNYASTVTLEETSVNGVYKISDFGGGVYSAFYCTAYGVCDALPGEITDVCNEISYSKTSDPFGSSIDGSGSRNPETGVITLSGYNEFGDSWTVVMTPK